jgi:RecA-family ATPase
MLFSDHHQGDTIMRQTENFVFEPLITNLVERNAVGMIVAPAKAKKSMLALNLVFSLLTKKPFLGLPVSSKPDRIVYVNLELVRNALGLRMRMMNQHYQATAKQMANVAFLTADEFTNKQPLVNAKTQTVNPEPFNKLMESCKEWGATVIIIDPLYYVVGEENDNVLMTAVIREFGKLRDELNATIFVVHHTAKGYKDWSDPFLAGRGASSLAGAFEFVLGIEPKEDNEAKLHHGSRNYAGVESFLIRFDTATLTWRAAHEATPDRLIDAVMKDKDEMLMSEFYKEMAIARPKAIALLNSCQTYEVIKAKGKQKTMLRRKMKT